MLASAFGNGDLQKMQALPWTNMSRSRLFVGIRIPYYLLEAGNRTSTSFHVANPLR